MQTFAQIPRRRLLIAGHPNSGWSIADEGTPGSFELEFDFRITGDGGAGYLLIYASLDGQYAADSWHRSFEEACAAADEHFGIERIEWLMAP